MSLVPTISVLLPVYNAERYLREAIESVLAQTFTDFELIAVDDGSTDGSLAILREFERRDGRVRVISRPNTGIVGALNDGLAVCRGEFVARMDGDDVCLPERFERQVAYLRKHPEVVNVGTAVRFIDPVGRPLLEPAVLTEHESIDAALLSGATHAMVHPSLMYRSEVAKRLGGYDVTLTIAEDIDFYLRCGEVGLLANVAEVLLHYRLHSGSVSVAKAEESRVMQDRVLQTASRRRGLETVFVPRGVRVDASVAENHRRWVWWALAGGFKSTARLYALKAIVKEPAHIESWRALACAVRGR
ncbi:glycosyltransferase [Cyanobium sp. Cruz-8H5]|uniref:glycosyltransferase n=1 Tax=Cyanobium sp. Cruz-8H5 TaxID=2823712 RepID=UPI0020CE54AB|nr:glycosyltransferase [Cyanobium sp. Cruz-8H5]MCP9861487.1 glycosyltransferase [Cyanobium sp. Cruz-8H5]